MGIQEKQISGYVMQIQNFSVNDGEGIRTNIFLAGCPLKCIWCCNPEHAYSFQEEHEMSIEQVKEKIQAMDIFYRNCNGGITFSGGEATCQEGFLRALTECFYDMGYNLALETCGYFEFDDVKDILEKMDLIFVDIKHMDAKMHQLFTGKSNEKILNNIKRLAKLNKQVVIRIPVICGVNATKENMGSTFAFIHDIIPSAKVELLPYHIWGTDKYKKLGLQTPDQQYEKCKKEIVNVAEKMSIPDRKLLDVYAEIAAQYHMELTSYK